MLMKKTTEENIKTARKLVSGFTLIETLVAIAVFSLVASAAYTASYHSISNSIFARDQIIAFYLAQEGIEYVRYQRDTNALSRKEWSSGLEGAVPELPSEFSQFEREVTVKFKENEVEALITSTVSWTQGTKEREISVHNLILDIR